MKGLAAALLVATLACALVDGAPLMELGEDALAPTATPDASAAQLMGTDGDDIGESDGTDRRGAASLPKGVAKKPEEVPDNTKAKVKGGSPADTSEKIEAKDAKAIEKANAKAGKKELLNTGLLDGKKKDGQKPNFTAQAGSAHADWPTFVKQAEKKVIAIKNEIANEMAKGEKLHAEYQKRVTVAAAAQAQKNKEMKKESSPGAVKKAVKLLEAAKKTSPVK